MRAAGASLLLLAGCITAEAPDLPNLHLVEEGVLYRSGRPTALGLAYARDELGVRTVINLSPSTIDEELVMTQALGLDYLPLPTKTYGIERENLVTVLAAVRQAAQEGRAPVLVHCRSGQDRSGTAVALFRAVDGGWTQADARAELRSLRHWTHNALFRHLPGPDLTEAEVGEMLAEAMELTGRVEILRPPQPWPPVSDGRPASGVAPSSGIEVTDRPGIL